MTQDDPVVERIRAARRRIVAACGGDPHKIYEWAKKNGGALQRAHLHLRARGASFKAGQGMTPLICVAPVPSRQEGRRRD